MIIAYQGEPGAFSEAAVGEIAPRATASGKPTFQEVFEVVAGGAADRAVVPIENSVAGSVPEVLDLLAVYAGRGLRVTAERWVRVEQALLALPGTTLADVREVRSHPQALGQGAAFLDEHAPGARRVPAFDTAGAAREVAEEKLEGVAAVASRRAAELYGLDVLAEHIEADARNYTRFVVVEREKNSAGDADKSSLVITPSEQVPNALFRALTTFVGRRLTLYRIEPRPFVGRPGRYRYFVDVEGDAAGESLSAAIADASAFCDRVLVLGSYRAHTVS